MSQLYILKEVKKVTEIAKNIFGDIVAKVYYAERDYSDDYNRVVNSINHSIETAFNCEESIEQDGKDIVIEFTNGRKVMFSNSEWGCMESFYDSDIKKIIN